MHNKKLSSTVAIFAAAVAVFSAAKFARAADNCNDHVVISQIYGGGGNSGATYKNDFIELYNPTENAVSISDWSVQYATTSGPFTNSNITNLSGDTIQPKSYYLIAEAKGSGGTEELPIPDKTGVINLSASAGKVALARSAAAINSENDPSAEDFVIYSTGSNTKSVFRDPCFCPNNFFADIPTPRNNSIVENGGEKSKIDGNASQDEPTKCVTSSKYIKLNEIFPYPESGDEFVEITNTGADCVDVSGWKVMDEAGHKKTFPENSIAGSGEYLYLEGNFYLNNDSDTAYLLDANGNTKNDALDKVFYEKAKKDYVYALSDGSFSWTSAPTPGEENVIATPEAAGKNTPETNNPQGATENYISNANIYLNEILPNPKNGSDDEYIEITNGGAEPVDLFGWRVKDASKSKGHEFKEHIILDPDEYLAIYRPDSKIALNNSTESVYLYNPKNEIISSISFEKSQKDASYNFDGKTWKWSKYLTPGKKNKFDSEPSVKITKPKNAYKDIFTEFSAKAKDKETKKLKYTWDFGDGKKSYLAKTSHKYLDTGKYTVALSVSDDSQTIEKSFSINVKKSPRPNIEITKILPNPTGKDSEGEIVEVKNNSKKKINLTGWKIATGSGEKIYNHPISGEFSLAPNETKTITHEFSKFSLNNKAGKVQLVMPDGKVIDEIEYSKEKIAEDETYAKMDGEWKWLTPSEQEKNMDESDTTEEDITADDQNNDEYAENGEVLGATDENISVSPSYDSSFTSEDAYVFLSRINFVPSSGQETNYCPASNPSSNIAYLIASLI
ncbi:MAG: lamin tail domain-containing protein [Candidatus Moranbacteria bacterium]|nr:lamin tail domain-containing protein [Candidatus Moranbacteria bacterium]